MFSEFFFLFFLFFFFSFFFLLGMINPIIFLGDEVGRGLFCVRERNESIGGFHDGKHSTKTRQTQYSCRKKHCLCIHLSPIVKHSNACAVLGDVKTLKSAVSSGLCGEQEIGIYNSEKLEDCSVHLYSSSLALATKPHSMDLLHVN